MLIFPVALLFKDNEDKQNIVTDISSFSMYFVAVTPFHR